ncbi:MAG: phytoene/squalene synthase family protein [bacterium]|nr:phytoene/squalene synthase family protein [bacterium]
MNYTSIQLSEAYEHCRDLTINADSNFALGFRFLPKIKRDSIYAVYAFNRLADDFADEIEFENERLNKLEKWELMLEDCYKGKASHPVMIAFTDTINRYKIPIDPFKEAMEGFKMDLSINRYKTFEDLKPYCERVAGTISVMSLHIFGWTDDRAFEYGNYLSYALQLTNIIRDVGKDIDKDRIYLPLDELEKFGYTEKELFSRTENDKFFSLMDFQIKRAEEYFEKANSLLSVVEPDSKFTVLLIGGVYSRLLRKIQNKGVPVLHKEIKLTKLEKIRSLIEFKLNPVFI